MAYPHDYFPFAVGNEWRFSYPKSDSLDSTKSIMIIKIVSDTIVLGKQIFKMTDSQIALKGNDTTYKPLPIEWFYYSNGSDIYYAPGISWVAWWKAEYDHSYYDGEKIIFNNQGRKDSVSVKYIGTYNRFDSCYKENLLSDTAYYEIFANDIGPVNICGYVLDTFIQAKTAMVQAGGPHVIAPAGQRQYSNFQGENEFAYAVNGRLLGKLPNSFFNVRNKYSSGILIIKKSDGYSRVTAVKRSVYH